MIAPRNVFSLFLALLVASALTAGCADDPVAYSGVVSTKLSGVKPGDFKNGVASVDKNINTETGNPYGAFLKDARDALGGKDLAEIVVIDAVVRVHADSKNVTTVDPVFADLELFIATSDTTLPIATLTGPSGSEVVMPLRDAIDFAAVQAALVGGDFKVGVRGSAVDPLPADFDLKLSLDLRFEAY